MILAASPPKRDNATLVHAATLALQQGLEVAAGIIARTALETHLRSLCQAHDWEPGHKHPSATQYLSRLYNKHHVTKTTHRDLKRAIACGNRCAHGQAVAWWEVESLVSVTKTFMQTHPLPWWWEAMAG